MLAACLRLYHLGYYSLWMDEVYQVSLQSRAISLGQVTEFAAQQNQPPLDYIIGYFISEFVPFSEFSVRFPSFIFGTGTVIVAFVFVRRLFNFWTAILSSLMLSFSTILIYYSQEARPYSIFFFFLMVLLTIFFWILESSGEKNRRWFLFIFIAALTLITRGMVPVTALIALNFAFILSVLVSYVEEKKFVYPFSPIVLRNLVLSTAIA